MLAQSLFVKRRARARPVEDEPFGRAVLLAYQQQLFVRRPPAEVCDASTGEPAAAHETVTRLARPTRLDDERADARAKRDARPDHRRAADAEAMAFVLLDTDARAPPVGLAREHGQRRQQPLHARRAHQVIRRAQGYVLGHIATPLRPRPPLRLSQGQRPCFIKFAHDLRIRVKRIKVKAATLHKRYDL